MALNLHAIGKAVRGALRLLDSFDKQGKKTPGSAARPAARQPARVQPAPPARKTQAPELSGAYPGDFRGTAAVRYAPSPNGLPEPGEVVWTWVPYEEDHSQGKDRPVLLVGTSGRYLLGLMLTSKDHDDDHQAADYVDIGTGAWDRQRRPSEAKLDRVLQINPRDVRREGAVLDARRFDLVAAQLRARHGWT